MEKELKTLPNEISPEEDSIVDHYIDRTPAEKSSSNIRFTIGIFIIVFLIVIVVGIVIYFCCCRSEKGEQNEEITRINSNTSTVSNISQN
jgi:flagellar basal body-associated protein FliL